MHALLGVIGLVTSVVTLPSGALVVEEQLLPNTVHGPRALLLWMLSPQASDCAPEKERAPSCLDRTRGCYLRGPARVSLIDPTAGHLINTVNILDPATGADSFDVPRRLYSAGPYHVERDHQARV